MQIARYREILGELEIFIELGMQVSLRLVGTAPEHSPAVSG